MSSAEFTESLAFEQLEPDPAVVTMNLAAQTLALFSNVYRDRKEHPEPYMATDFLPQHAPGKAEVENRRKYDEAIRLMRANYQARGLGRRH